MRYFAYSLNQIWEIEQKIKKKEIASVFQVILSESAHIKRFTWCLLNLNINFKRSPLGSGITIFYVDMNIPFFLSPKEDPNIK